MPVEDHKFPSEMITLKAIILVDFHIVLKNMYILLLANLLSRFEVSTVLFVFSGTSEMKGGPGLGSIGILIPQNKNLDTNAIIKTKSAITHFLYIF